MRLDPFPSEREATSATGLSHRGDDGGTIQREVEGGVDLRHTMRTRTERS
jgi:hypothetical protein